MVLEFTKEEILLLIDIVDEKFYRLHQTREDRLSTESQWELSMGYEPFQPLGELNRLFTIKEKLCAAATKHD